MSEVRILIVGERGLVAQRLRERLEKDDFEVQVISTDEALTGNLQGSVNGKDVVVLCGQDFVSSQVMDRLPDGVRVLDVSPTFRNYPSWVYGLPELHDGYDKIRHATRVANPGCFATAAILALEPPTKGRMIPRYTHVYLDATAGYSSGGTKLINQVTDGLMVNETMFSLNREHRHVQEIKTHSGASGPVIFHPKVDPLTFSGTRMVVSIPNVRADELRALYREVYQGTEIIVLDDNPSSIKVNDWADKEGACLRVYENEIGSTVICTLDNLLKGAVSAAVRNVTLMTQKA